MNQMFKITSGENAGQKLIVAETSPYDKLPFTPIGNDRGDYKENTQEKLLAEKTATEMWHSFALEMGSLVFVFGLIVIIIAALLIKFSNRNTDSIIRVFGVILIVIAALFLLVAGYSDKQLAPAFGLLGTIAGYLFGKEVSKKDDDKKDDGKKDETKIEQPEPDKEKEPDKS